MNKILLITGASSDIGMELLLKVANKYESILIQYNTMTEKFDKVIKEAKMVNKNIFPMHANFLDDNSTDDFISNIHRMNLVPTNVVHLPSMKAYNQKFHKDNIDNFYRNYKISFVSLLKILYNFLPYMIKNHYGRIVVMLSSYTFGRPPKNQSSYVSTKYALLGLLKSISEDYYGKGITINGVSPEMIETKFLDNIPDLLIKMNAEKKPSGKNLTVNDVLPTIIKLLDNNDENFSGNNILIKN